ncbi:MAG: DNA-binding transcriptional regulator HxlR family [Candidatus Methanohalarchaeum thermophilum]|uniref:DNA-binding transcriptional regulator HxlR family n=1 Tax=Methanohalarchaeum thermophilum TaxID=1903181 RepID=A0A1Q6DVN0_METT1|nr:MAG: DNA-binding transcriptional regulator HxlR family [Candidatus Methanohalarchaeum thermophilum]
MNSNKSNKTETNDFEVKIKAYGKFKKSELEILSKLREKNLKFSEIVEKTDLSKSVVSNALNNLKKEKLIKKRGTKEDKRVKIYEITSKGKKEHEKIIKKILKELDKIIKEFREILGPNSGILEDISEAKYQRVFKRYDS